MDYDSWKIADLKALLKQRKLSTVGRKNGDVLCHNFTKSTHIIFNLFIVNFIELIARLKDSELVVRSRENILIQAVEPNRKEEPPTEKQKLNHSNDKSANNCSGILIKHVVLM